VSPNRCEPIGAGFVDSSIVAESPAVMEPHKVPTVAPRAGADVPRPARGRPSKRGNSMITHRLHAATRGEMAVLPRTWHPPLGTSGHIGPDGKSRRLLQGCQAHAGGL
jgi:hypothetical protein